jgi:hypothetical protein
MVSDSAPSSDGQPGDEGDGGADDAGPDRDPDPHSTELAPDLSTQVTEACTDVGAQLKLGERYEAVILDDGSFRLADGSVHQSPSMAAMKAADLVSYDGWYAWRVPRLGGTKLHELRDEYVVASAST